MFFWIFDVENKIYLVIAAHGSRSAIAVSEVEAFSRRLKGLLSDFYISCQPAFLEMATPTIFDCVDSLITEGADEVHVLPYFLTSGVHVTRDIPMHINTVSERFPDAIVKILPAIGLAPQMALAVESIVIDQFTDA